MSGGYRGIIAALIGCVALTSFGLGSYVTGLNKPDEQGHQRYRYAADKPLELDPSVASKSQSKALEYREPCREPKGREESDLCAQWRAAKAGEDGAFWAKWGFWATCAGIIGLIATILQGRAGLSRAREANDISRQGMIAQTRPILVFDGWDIEPMAGAIPAVLLRPIWKNVGQTPALAVQSTIRRSYLRGNARDEDIAALLAAKGRSFENREIIATNERAFGTAIRIGANDVLPATPDQFGRRLQRIVLAVASVNYFSAIDQRASPWETTEIDSFAPTLGTDGGFMPLEMWGNTPPQTDRPLKVMT